MVNVWLKKKKENLEKLLLQEISVSAFEELQCIGCLFCHSMRQASNSPWIEGAVFVSRICSTLKHLVSKITAQ